MNVRTTFNSLSKQKRPYILLQLKNMYEIIGFAITRRRSTNGKKFFLNLFFFSKP